MEKRASSNGETLKINLSISEYIQGCEAHLAENEKADFSRRSSITILDLYDFKPECDLIQSERKIAALLFRIRSRQAKVNPILLKWNLVDSPNCSVCDIYEDVLHVLQKIQSPA